MSSFTLLSLDYYPLMQGYYHKLSHLPGFVLLESTDKKNGRYDIISALPYDWVHIEPNTASLSTGLKRINGALNRQPSVADLPFQGGAIGYVSYDLGAQRLGIHSLPQPTLEDMPLLSLGLYDWAIIVDHHQEKAVLFAANTQPNTPVLVEEIVELWNKEGSVPKPTQLKGEFTPLITKEQYYEAFSIVHKALIKGRSYQVNYTQNFHAAYEGDGWEFYKKISQKNPVPFSAFLRLPQAEILSFSPERFLLYNQGKLLTSPIKGTIGRSCDPVTDKKLMDELAASEKNRAENVMIVDLLRNDLGRIAQPGSVRVTSLCAIESYSAVHHLVSTIEAQSLPNIQPFDAFLSCFPGGSITGAPKIEAMHVIHELEPYARGVYCGSIGYFSRHGYFDTNIAIRTIMAKNNLLHLAAGGGIVIDSDAEDEYRECFIKIAAIINGLK